MSSIDWEAIHRRLDQDEMKLSRALAPAPREVARILQARAAALRKRSRKVTAAQALFLHVSAGEDRLLIPLGALAEVFRLRNVTPVPGAPAAVAGVINVRGELCAVLLAEPLLELSSRETGPASKYGLLLRHPRLRVIIAVERVHGIEAFPEGELGATPEAMVRLGDKLAIRLDRDVLFRQIEQASGDPISL